MKSETPSFVLEQPLKTTSVQETIILTRLEAGRQLYNACIGEALKRLDHIRQSREFQKVRVATRAFKAVQKKAFKKPLSQRWHVCCGVEMQRDLYSAFLSKCVDVSTGSLDIARARMPWPGLEPVLSEAVSRAYQSASGRKVPASFGLEYRRQSGSPVKPEATITEAVDDVIRMYVILFRITISYRLVDCQ